MTNLARRRFSMKLVLKGFYNREMIDALHYEILKMSFISTFPSMQLKLANHDKVDGLSANSEIHKKVIVSLL